MNAIDAVIDVLDAGDLGKLAEMIGSTLIEAEGEDGWTPLFYSVANGDIRAVKILLDAGADRQHLDHNGWSAAMLAAFEGKTQIARMIEAA
ncbi:ankyrin repeat domain-containing protein [Sphingomonas azotifigens]|uniref:ankyrin repeat domain-containing protein n=1 Tax=Sphingomonas azotifigens TaxID=330920 RepID=UPI0014319418|nr:ankyrin repeat domain-containing protein [Sphingomonas azotifigens]